MALHGLEGSSSVHYMRGLADQAWRRGWNAVLLNQRNCGGTEHLTPSLYHSGLTADPREVIRALVATDGLTDVGVVGYSLGGNLDDQAGRRTGRRARCPGPRRGGGLPDDRPRALCPRDRTTVRTSPTSSTSCATSGRACGARRRPGQAPSTWRRSRASGRFDASTTRIRRHIMASATPTNYYRRASALRVVDRIRMPALISRPQRRPVRAARTVQRRGPSRERTCAYARLATTADTAPS